MQHTFLQRLPNIPQLRSINIPHIADYITTTFEPRELAHQIADIITLRPEIRLCYVGIGPKCFEILEAPATGVSSGFSSATSPVATTAHGSNGQTGTSTNLNGIDDDNQEEDTTDDDDDDEGVDAEDSEDSEEDLDDNTTPTTATSDPDETQSDNEAAGQEEDSDDDGFVEPDAGLVKLRLREILFYDDKVAIFRARHGKL